MGANTEYPPRTHPGTNIHEVHTLNRKVLTREHNELFIQQVVQYYQVADGDELNYRVLGLNKSQTGDDIKKA